MGPDDPYLVDGPVPRHAGGPIHFACFTHRGTTPMRDIESVLEEHKQWLAEQEKARKIVAAGPLLTEDLSWFGDGIIVFRVESEAQAEQLALQDPMHSRGIRTFKIVPWQLNEGSFEITLRFSTGEFYFRESDPSPSASGHRDDADLT